MTGQDRQPQFSENKVLSAPSHTRNPQEKVGAVFRITAELESGEAGGGAFIHLSLDKCLLGCCKP